VRFLIVEAVLCTIFSKCLRVSPAKRDSNFYLIDRVGGGLQLGPLALLPAPGDCDDGETGGMIGRETEAVEKTWPSVALSTTNLNCCPDANPGRRRKKPGTNRFSYGTA
jgi:hypothetical protein